MRKLVSVREISALHSIPDADQIEIAEIDGWKVVVKKGSLKVGDQCLYSEIDSMLPVNDPDLPQFAFLEKNAKYEEGNLKYARIRTIRLRKQISQGICFSLTDFGDYFSSDRDRNKEISYEDLVNKFKVKLYEPPQVSIGGVQRIKGNFPIFIPKTDVERIQNMFNEVKNRDFRPVWNEETQTLLTVPDDMFETYEVTIKLDGTSMTVYKTAEHDFDEEKGWQEHFGVCSKNFEIEEDLENRYWQAVYKYNLKDKMVAGYAIQGELCGPGIQQNPEKLTEYKFFVYNVYDINRKCYLNPIQRRNFVNYLGLEHVPVLDEEKVFTFNSVQDILNYAEGKSYNHDVEREGLVFKSNIDTSFSFKTISNKYLLSEK